MSIIVPHGMKYGIILPQSKRQVKLKKKENILIFKRF